MIERGQSLWSKLSKTQFIRSSATLFLNHFFIILLQRFRDMDLISAILEDDALLTVIGSINTARYCEYILHEWNEDIGFLEMAVNDKDPDNLFFNDEISFLVKLETDCLVEIVSALLLQFDALSSYYIHDIEQWEREQTEFDDQILEDENMNVSPSFIEALDMLRHRFQVLRLSLNSKDFVEIWRNVAEGLDHFIFSSILLSNVKFSQHGAYQFIMDVKALFLVFKPFCPRPEAFFPCISDSLKLLGMDRKDVKYTLKVLAVEGVISEERLRARGLFHVSVDQGLKILRNRKFEGQFNM
ncbi:uncharacterized protein A4U43_UnF1200 [Asparagus officinalis]|uniref:Uncharacterized protein n=2 Tax=Asparagus officinalis TaxID=4686 RepID=A0A1R3L7J2_ASPOF|nr:uncharacterized protein A4U43_UnF1200 [Asparagus officinalis]